MAIDKDRHQRRVAPWYFSTTRYCFLMQIVSFARFPFKVVAAVTLLYRLLLLLIPLLETVMQIVPFAGFPFKVVAAVILFVSVVAAAVYDSNRLRMNSEF
jgi:hypothetical protein